VPTLNGSFVFVSNALDRTITVFHIDRSDSHLRFVEEIQAGESVMPLCVAPGATSLYAAIRGSAPAILNFAIDAASGHLSLRHIEPVGAPLVHLTMNRTGTYLLAASYGDSLLNLYDASAALLQSITDIPQAHAAIVSPDDRFVYVSSLGTDSVLCLELRTDLTLIETVFVESGFGPRHLCLSPAGDTLYVLSEMRATVAVFQRDVSSGRLLFQSISPRPADLSHLADGIMRPRSTDPVQIDPTILATLVWAADLHVRPDGRFLYASERTSSRLLIYRVSAQLEYAGCADTEEQPRGFAIDASGKFLVACGEKSQQVSLYSIDEESGALTLVSRSSGGRGANWVEIIAAQETE
jgi:6-phosphogluconolactonase